MEPSDRHCGHTPELLIEGESPLHKQIHEIMLLRVESRLPRGTYHMLMTSFTEFWPAVVEQVITA